MRKSNDQSIKEVIGEILETYKLKGRLDEVKLRNSWEKLMGKAVSSRTRSISLKDGMLIIQVTSAPLSQELYMGASKIISLLNREIGEEIIREIRIC